MNTEEPEIQSEQYISPPKPTQGKDEMNLAEFPLSAIADRVDPSQKTLVFEDRIWDESRGATITRQLTITASDHYGLPTAIDDEVILGLIQISKFSDFADRRVVFTRYQLIQLLGWSDNSKSYERLEKSLNRWVGVTLYYKNAWWDKENKSWVDEKFHIIDNVTLYDREKAKAARERGGLAQSTFTWNDVLFRSFNVGNLKSLDFDFYKGLESAIAKRLFRFLDKRFYHRLRWEFDLKEVSWEHIGLSRNYDAANLKRRLLSGIRELEQKGFLRPMCESERFKKVKSGDWRVVFESAKAKAPVRTQIAGDESSVLTQALIERGVTASTAAQVVGNFAADRIQTQMEVFDWLKAQNDPKVVRNPAGFLIASIKSEYVPPKGFVSREEQARRDAEAEKRKKRADEQARLKRERELAQKHARDAAVADFWQSLSDEERRRLENEAMTRASQIEREVMARGGAFGEAARKSLLDAYALKFLREAA